MQKRSIALLALAALAAVLAYYFYYYEAESMFFTGPAGNLVLVATVFLTGFLLSLPRAHGGHGHEHRGHEHGHDHGHQHGHEHQGHEHPAMQPDAPRQG